MHSFQPAGVVHGSSVVCKHLYYTILQGWAKGLEGPHHCPEIQYVGLSLKAGHLAALSVYLLGYLTLGAQIENFDD